MATLIASASAVSSHSSAQPDENNIFNDSLSFSNQSRIEKRRISAAWVLPPLEGLQSVTAEVNVCESEGNHDNLGVDHGWCGERDFSSRI